MSGSENENSGPRQGDEPRTWRPRQVDVVSSDGSNVVPLRPRDPLLGHDEDPDPPQAA